MAVVISYVAAGHPHPPDNTETAGQNVYIKERVLGWKCIKIEQPEAIGERREIAPPSIYYSDEREFLLQWSSHRTSKGDGAGKLLLWKL